MPTPLPHFEGAVPLWDYAVRVGIGEDDLLAGLRADRTDIFEVSVAGKKVYFVNKNDLASYMMRNAQKADAGSKGTNSIQPGTTKKVMDQAPAFTGSLRESIKEMHSTLDGLRRQLESVLAEQQAEADAAAPKRGRK